MNVAFSGVSILAAIPQLLGSLVILSLVGVAVLWVIGQLQRRGPAIRQRIVIRPTAVRFRRQQDRAERPGLLPSSLPERSPPTFHSERADDADCDRDLS
jgi:hypothetical protein